MDILRFAVCITMHGTTSQQVVAAALDHGVHILDKEHYNPMLNYNSVIREYNDDVAQEIMMLFVFPDYEPMLLSKDDNISEILRSIDMSVYIRPTFN